MLRWLGFSAALYLKTAEPVAGATPAGRGRTRDHRRPELLLCDEPTSNLDAKRARRLMHLFTQLRRLGTTVVLATHSDDLVDRYPHPVLRLSDGYLSGPILPAGVTPVRAPGATK